jgi:predicted dehydrogenase
MAIGVTLLGCRHPHVPDVLSVIASEPDVRLAAVWAGDRGAVPGPVSSYAVSSADTAIGRADAVIVCAPLGEREQLCVRAARAGRPILVDGPLATAAAESRAVAREVARSRTPAYANLFLRQLPALGRLRAWLGADVLGRVTSAGVTYLRPAMPDGAAAAGRGARPGRPAAGDMVELGIHPVDALAALSARPRLDAVRLDRPRGAPTDLGGAAVGRWGDVPLSLRVSGMARPGGLEVVVNGTVATARLRDGTLELSADAGVPERWIGAPPDPADGVRAFLGRLRARRLDLTGLEDVVSAHETIERAAAF